MPHALVGLKLLVDEQAWADFKGPERAFMQALREQSSALSHARDFSQAITPATTLGEGNRSFCVLTCTDEDCNLAVLNTILSRGVLFHVPLFTVVVFFIPSMFSWRRDLEECK